MLSLGDDALPSTARTCSPRTLWTSSPSPLATPPAQSPSPSSSPPSTGCRRRSSPSPRCGRGPRPCAAAASCSGGTTCWTWPAVSWPDWRRERPCRCCGWGRTRRRGWRHTSSGTTRGRTRESAIGKKRFTTSEVKKDWHFDQFISAQ